jgi:hypothetical protein
MQDRFYHLLGKEYKSKRPSPYSEHSGTNISVVTENEPSTDASSQSKNSLARSSGTAVGKE